MTVRAPNSEQQNAIFHKGGVLLNAGAGSGKTYVIVEHICYLINEFVKEKCTGTPQEDLKIIKKYMSSIAVITYTKDAARELLSRIRKRIQENIDMPETDDMWNTIYENLAIMNIGTIHSFCLKFLADENSKIIGKKISIIDDHAYKEMVENSINDWFRLESENVGINKNIVLNNYDAVSGAMIKVLSDSQLRLVWAQLDVEGSFNSDMAEYFKELISVIGVDAEFENGVSLVGLEDYKEKSWYSFISGFSLLWKEGPPHNKYMFEKYMSHFDSFKRVVAPKKHEDANNYFLAVRRFRDVLKKYRSDFDAYYSGEVTSLKSWLTTLKDLFVFLHSNYKTKLGISFADIEYFAFSALEDSDFASRVHGRYEYIIIDEFQDTSQVQFDIINKILKKDLSKLFAVGDLKQAIYGFRGGELKVFKDCAESVGENLSLLSNYRSHEQVVKFNNEFFSTLFPVDSTLKDLDKHSVDYDHQKCKQENMVESGISREIVTLEGVSKSDLSFKEINELEAKVIALKIKEGLSLGKYNEICVLYKKLSPSRFLINHLIEAGIGFTAQFKISCDEEPLLAIFFQLVLSLKNRDDIDTTCLFIKGYLLFVGQEISEQLLKQAVVQFRESTKLVGVYQSFISFLYYLRLSTSNHDVNLKSIEIICRNALDDIERVGLLLELTKKDSITTTFAYGDNPSMVLIKTCHSTKGLEYDYCILAGIHTNGRRFGNRSVLGKLPQSILWKKDITDRKRCKSPSYILEDMVAALKDFSESKRLFYVACTRAVKKIGWVELYDSNNKLLSSGNSWANLILHTINTSGSISNLINVSNTQLKLSANKVGEGVPDYPLFHVDNCGIIERVGSVKDSTLGILGEISVRKLADLVVCKRKFYYSVICSLNDDDISKLLELKGIDKESSFAENSEAIEVKSIKSSSDRGTAIHKVIADLIDHKKSLDDLTYLDQEDAIAVDWIYKKYVSKEDILEFYSEKTFKFKLFGIMLTGIPDLVLLNKSSSKYTAEVWDFKTGGRSELNEEYYWFQVYSYAYGIFSYGLVDQDALVLVSLDYVDEKISIEREVSKNEITEFLFAYWSGISSFTRTESLACSHCQYNGLFC